VHCRCDARRFLTMQCCRDGLGNRRGEKSSLLSKDSTVINVHEDAEETLTCWGKTAQVVGLFDTKYLLFHLIVNVLTVDVWNIGLEHTFCKNELLACCDPFNWMYFDIAGFPCNGWLVGHWIAYCFAGLTYGKTDLVAHLNLIVCQLGWFWFEYFTYFHTYEWEQDRFYSTTPVPEGSCRTLELCEKTSPCPTLPYYSTWIPIWQDFVYNTLGQLAGLLLFLLFAKRGYMVTMGFQVVEMPALEHDEAQKKVVRPWAITLIVSVIIVVVMLVYNAHKF